MSEAALQLECSVRRFLEEGRSVTLIALGGSMYPAIVAGTQLALSPDIERRPAPGDVVAVARPDGGIAIHRVVAVRPDGRVLTWGDALPRPDGWGPSRVLGWARVVWSPWSPSTAQRWAGQVRRRAHLLLGPLVSGRGAG